MDAIVIGDGEEKSTQIALTWKRLKEAGVPRKERLVAIAKLAEKEDENGEEPPVVPDTPAPA